MSNFLVILSSPSGGGKTTIARRLLDRRGDLSYSVSCTTRPPRAGERPGLDYHFLSAEEFARKSREGAFAESAQVHGFLYGTLREEIDKVLGGGQHVIMDIDVQGARTLRAAYPDAVTVFILPPSGATLVKRLRNRRTESRESFVGRLRWALQELDAVTEYSYVVVNDSLDAAVESVSGIIDGEVLVRRRVENLRAEVEGIIESVGSEFHTEQGSEKQT